MDDGDDIVESATRDKPVTGCDPSTKQSAFVLYMFRVVPFGTQIGAVKRMLKGSIQRMDRRRLVILVESDSPPTAVLIISTNLS